MNYISFVDVVQAYCNLEQTVECSLGIQILILILEELLLDPFPEGPALQLLQEHQLLALQVIDLEDLHNMDMISNINPFLHLLLQDIFLFLGGQLLQAVRAEDSVLFLQDQVCW